MPASFLAAQNPRAEAVLPFLDYARMIEESPVDEKPSAILTGKERDSESGLDYFGARYYWSSAGRFSSPDPLDGDPSDPQTWNKYSYTSNNPLIRVDPDGLRWYRRDGTEPQWVESADEAKFREDNPDWQAWDPTKEQPTLAGQVIGGEGYNRYGVDENGNPTREYVGGLGGLQGPTPEMLAIGTGAVATSNLLSTAATTGAIDYSSGALVGTVSYMVSSAGDKAARLGQFLNNVRSSELSDWIRTGRTFVPADVVGKGAKDPRITWAIKGGGTNSGTGVTLPFHYHIHKFNWYAPWRWFTYTPMKKP